MPITEKHLNANHCYILSKTERNPTVYTERLGNVSRDCWVSLYIFSMGGAWKIDALFLKPNPSIIFRSTQPTRNNFPKLTPMAPLKTAPTGPGGNISNVSLKKVLKLQDFKKSREFRKVVIQYSPENSFWSKTGYFTLLKCFGINSR